MSNETETVSTTQTASPSLPNMPFLSQGFSEAARLYNQGAQVPDAYKAIETRLLGPSGQHASDWNRRAADTVAQYATGHHGQYFTSPTLQRFMSGEMLSPDSNPWLKGAYEDAAGALRGQISSQFAGSGRYGSGANQEILGRNLGQLANQMYGGAYQQGIGQMLSAGMMDSQLQSQDTGRRMQAAAMVPGLMDSDLNSLFKLGLVQQGQINAPWENLQRYMGVVNPGINFGGSTTSQQPYFSNPVGQGIGLLGSGLSAANMAFGQNGLFPGAAQSGASNLWNWASTDPFGFSLPSASELGFLTNQANAYLDAGIAL